MLEEIDKYNYLNVIAEGGVEGGFKSLDERMKDAGGVIGMVKYAAKRSGSKFESLSKRRMEVAGGE